MKRMPDALEALIKGIAVRFAEGVLEAVRSSSITELVEAREAATPVRAKRRAASAAPPRETRRSSAGRNVTAITAALHTAGRAGLQAEQLRADLGITKPSFHYAVGKAIEAGLVRRTGTKRGTRYFTTSRPSDHQRVIVGQTARTYAPRLRFANPAS